MKRLTMLILMIGVMISGCVMQDNHKIETLKNEIRQTEKAFADMVAKEGLHKAFTHFAADDAVLLRQEKLIVGKAAIDEYYDGADATGLAWEPDHIDVAESGELAYTYGHYTNTYENENGEKQQSTGIFHTIWKRQPDGSWKFVWD
jgi:ketosteroid isomerase-like protein